MSARSSRSAFRHGQYDGYRVFPIGHEHHRRRREREVREVQAALAWYGPAHYDASS